LRSKNTACGAKGFDTLYLCKMEEKLWFKNWFNSPYYHLLYANRDDSEAAAFITTLVQFFKPNPGAKMLDVGCGRGRHSRQLAALGFEVTGIDVAPENIRFAKQFANPQLHFEVHDMRQLYAARSMDFVFNFFTSFGYFNTSHEHVRALHMMATALRKKGVLILDYVNSDVAIEHQVKKEQKIIRQVQFTIERWNNATHLFKRIEVEDPKKGIRLSHTEKVVRFSKNTLTSLLLQQGLTIKNCWGDYQLNTFDLRQSPRMIFYAEREN
jgi:SAM-dependent methyltransferase